MNGIFEMMGVALTALFAENFLLVSCMGMGTRLSAFRDCTQIVVMKNGKIIQQGTHKDLMQQEGLYRTFVQNI